MAATVEWQFADDSVGTLADVTTLRFKFANNNVNDLNDPLVRPTLGTNYSFEKALKINVQAAGGATQLSELRVKLDVSSPGVTLGNVNQNYGFQTAYTQPQQYSGGLGGIGNVSPGKEGTLNTSEVPWTNDGNGNHNFSADGAGDSVVWKDAQFLYCQLEVGTGIGGTMSWQTIAVYNEI